MPRAAHPYLQNERAREAGLRDGCFVNKIPMQAAGNEAIYEETPARGGGFMHFRVRQEPSALPFGEAHSEISAKYSRVRIMLEVKPYSLS